jgi:hypothetical protein
MAHEEGAMRTIPGSLIWFVAAGMVLSACSDSAGFSGQVGAPCETVLDCGATLICEPTTQSCQPRPDAGPGVDAAPADAAPTDGALVDAAPAPDSDVPDVQVPVVDGGLASCLFVPPPNAFAPRLECRYDTPVEFPQHDDAVMTPVVANVTDDDLDGEVTLDDVPDILVATYRLEEDGCCARAGVLRVLSGGCAPDATHLEEHFHLTDPFVDNSGGIAVGDLDGDGRPDIVAMRWISGTTTTGTVAWSSVRYEPQRPTVDSVTEDAFTPLPAGEAWSQVDEAVPDGVATRLVGTGPGSRQGFPATWGRTTAAIATVRVTALARAVGGEASFGTYLARGGGFHDGPARILPADGPFERVVLDVRKNPWNGGLQWVDADLAGLEYGVLQTGDATTGSLEVTQVFLTVGHVVKLWESDDPRGGAPSGDAYTGGQPTIVDLDRDGLAEVLVGRVVLDGATGETRWRGRGGRGINAFLGPISIAADLDLDGVMEVIAGNTVYRADGEEQWTYAYGAEGTGCSGAYACDGFNATGNFDADPEGEVVIVREGSVYVVGHDGVLQVRIPIPQDDCAWNEGGPPTVADFDGDGEPEIGVAAADYYVVLDLECCETQPDCTAIPAGATHCVLPGVRWYVPNQDCSSRVTASSVFDFDGDGAAEVVYNDEVYFRVFSGLDGAVLLEVPNRSHTRLEMPVIADVDNDGNAEIVFIENGAGRTTVQVWGDANDAWVPTRRIWNQHAYHVTNIREDGSLPAPAEIPNWLVYNNYRQNLPDYNVFAAPDVTLEITGFGYARCPTSLEVRARVCNEGDLRVGAGLPVRLFDTATQAEIPCAVPPATLTTLNPGQCEAVTCVWPDPPSSPEPASVRGCADNAGWDCAGPGNNNECVEDNNQHELSGPGCSQGPG